MSELEPTRQWAQDEEAKWLVDKICIFGDYGQDAARVLLRQVAELSSLRSQVKELQNDLERERMRLAACSTAATGYFGGCIDEYKSASLNDVLALRERSVELQRQLDEAAKQEPSAG